jgi:ABC-type polysaccharide/polyol phosphate export permease
VAPIIFPVGILPERFHKYLYVWPPTPVIQYARAVLVDGTIPSLYAHLLLAGLTVAVLGTGIVVFRRLAPSVVECL